MVFTCLAQKNYQFSLTVFTCNWFLILDKIQDDDHVWWRHRPPAAPPPIKYTSSCREDLKAVHWWQNHSVATPFWGGREGREVAFIRFIRFIGVAKSQYKQDLHCSSYKEKTAPQLRRRVLQDFTFPRLVFIWAVWSSILKINVQNTMKDQQT